MISKKMQNALNEQIKHELFSSHLYLAMSSWCEAANFPGFAKWLRVQYKEEREHAEKFFDYLLDQGATATVPAVEAPVAKFKSVLDIFQQVVAHEKKITALVNKLQALAHEEGDWATQGLLGWFVQEQVEEEKHAGLLAAHLEMIGDKSAAILNLDHNAGKRAS